MLLATIKVTFHHLKISVTQALCISSLTMTVVKMSLLMIYLPSFSMMLPEIIVGAMSKLSFLTMICQSLIKKKLFEFLNF